MLKAKPIATELLHESIAFTDGFLFGSKFDRHCTLLIRNRPYCQGGKTYREVGSKKKGGVDPAGKSYKPLLCCQEPLSADLIKD
ncbi:MAG: hypothetical protein H7249_01920 [Chitinophagaceae bacterium]|nr:hypothetical protein [Oligoflexus sp.]